MVPKTWRGRLADELTDLLHLDIRFYGRSVSWLTLGHVAGVVRGIATTFLMARWLPPETLGQFRYVLAAFGIAGVFALSGMNSAVIRGVAAGDTITALRALRRILIVAPFGALALLLASAERWWAQEPIVALGLMVAAVAFVPYSVSGFYGLILTGQEKIRELTIVTMANNVLYALLFVGVLYWNRSFLVITIAYFGFDVLFRGALTIRELRRLKPAGSADTHLALGGHLSGMSVMQTIAAHLDSILIQRFGGYGSLALYGVATVIPEQLKNLVNSLGGTVLQRLSRHAQTEGHVRTTRRHFWLLFGGSVGLVAGYALVAPMAIPWLFPQYADAVPLSIVYAVGLLALPGMIGVYFLQAHGQLARLWRYFITNTALQLGANLLLIPFFGSWGAVWSKVVTRLASLPLTYPGAAPTHPPAASHPKASGR